MKKIAIATHLTLRDYIISNLCKEEVIITSILCWEKATSDFYKNIPVIMIDDIDKNDCDSVLIAFRNINLVSKFIEKLFFIKNTNKLVKLRKLYIVNPDILVSSKTVIWDENGFNKYYICKICLDEEWRNKFIKFFPNACLPINYESSKYVTNVVYTTDKIKAYEIKNVYIKYINDQPYTPQSVGLTFLEDNTVITDCFNSDNLFYYFSFTNFKYELRQDIVYNDPIICVLTRYCSDWNYAHFFIEVLDKILIAEELGYKGKYLLFHNRDAQKLLTWAGISIDRIIWFEKKDFNKIIFVKNSFNIEGFGFEKNINKSISRILPYVDKIINKLGANISSNSYPKLLFVKRDNRKLLGIESILKKYNFCCFIPEEHTLEEEVKFFYNADIVLCPHGAALTNALFMHQGATLIETCPYNYQVLRHRPTIYAKKLRYRVIVENSNYERNDLESGVKRNYYIDNDYLDYIIKDLLPIYGETNIK